MSTGFRRFRLTAKVPESSIITSFYLEPVDQQPLPKAAPGQYLPIRLRTEDGIVPRTYSISSDTSETRQVRITVKRESAPPHFPDVNPGKASSWLHDHAVIGTEIDIAGPRGGFFLDEESQRPVVLLSGGVGQTPLLSMLHSLARSERRVLYLHACENGDVHAMRDEVEALTASSNGRMQTHYCYRTPNAQDQAKKHFHSDGFVNTALLQSLLPIDDYEFYLCGPTPFMVALYRQLVELGVHEERIAYEFFGKSRSLATLVAEGAQTESSNTPKANIKHAAQNAPKALAKLVHLTDPDARAATDKSASSIETDEALEISPDHNLEVLHDEAVVVFSGSAITTKWSASSGSLLELAEQSGLNPDFSCRSGICGTCACAIEAGEVDYFEDPLELPESGQVLICCSRPRGRVVLKL